MPLVRLRVEHAGFETINPQSFGQQFADRVANPEELLLFHKRGNAATRAGSAAGSRTMTVPNNLEIEEGASMGDDGVKIQDIIYKYIEGEQGLAILPEPDLNDAVQSFVHRAEPCAIAKFVEEAVATTNDAVLRESRAVGEEEIRVQIQDRAEGLRRQRLAGVAAAGPPLETGPARGAGAGFADDSAAGAVADGPPGAAAGAFFAQPAKVEPGLVGQRGGAQAGAAVGALNEAARVVDAFEGGGFGGLGLPGSARGINRGAPPRGRAGGLVGVGLGLGSAMDLEGSQASQSGKSRGKGTRGGARGRGRGAQAVMAQAAPAAAVAGAPGLAGSAAAFKRGLVDAGGAAAPQPAGTAPKVARASGSHPAVAGTLAEGFGGGGATGSAGVPVAAAATATAFLRKPGAGAEAVWGGDTGVFGGMPDAAPGLPAAGASQTEAPARRKWALR